MQQLYYARKDVLMHIKPRKILFTSPHFPKYIIAQDTMPCRIHQVRTQYVILPGDKEYTDIHQKPISTTVVLQ